MLPTFPKPLSSSKSVKATQHSAQQDRLSAGEKAVSALFDAPYLVAARYVAHTALANVCDVLRAHAFSTSATIEDMLIFGCVWPLAAAT
ncbi:hypothetical protein [Bradyrhizobium sp. CB3481]|uniref:hypothetical protein n=1 Tax=Bradyrhizobium sp. CB3481 TaxID=3039158 RepID=UPI0024B202FC|nr:hypothetical protein [Bradyrhizobium sp. CB3481]WFU19481.1 hypothetical protein QA643_14690 [Bradyrhizobium sp. CB3481]